MINKIITIEKFKRYASFLGVGTIGFIVDASVLYTLMMINISAFYARIPAIVMAGSVTYVLNRQLTFALSGRGCLREKLRYAVGLLLASIINYGVFSGLLLLFPTLQPYFALIFASLSAMLISYYWHATIAFRKEHIA